ncbi:MAG: aminoacyl-tRNA hydrolase [Thermodesulfobacteriota bacterium]|nr:aminoacyl-tRNA hydrolase [Thermodesulfobacteriota bacterium]
MAYNQVIMVAGLGNPGEKYTRTRHNIGFLVVDELARRYSLSLDRSRFDAKYSKGVIKGVKVVLVKPESFMNRSGFPVQKLSSYYKIELSDIVVVHDDLDLEFGKIKIVKNRGHGGHNGIRSIIDSFGSKDFIRIRTGVGRPRGPRGVTGHVLGRFSPEEKMELSIFVEKAADAVIAVMEQGVTAAMNIYNSTF